MWLIPEIVKCPQCGRRLFDLKSKADFEVDIKCPRCKRLIEVIKSSRVITRLK